MSSDTEPTPPDDGTAPIEGADAAVDRADGEVIADTGESTEDATADEPTVEDTTTDEVEAAPTDEGDPVEAESIHESEDPASEGDAEKAEEAEVTEEADTEAAPADAEDATPSVRPPDAAPAVTSISPAASDETEQSRRRRWPWVAALLVAFALFTAGGVLAGATMSYAESLQGRLLPGTTIAGSHVGGMTHAEALEAVRGALKEELDRSIVVQWDGQRWETQARKLGARTNAADIIQSVAESQEGLTWQDWARLRWFGERADETAVVDVTYRRAAVRRFVASITDEVDLDPTDAELTVTGENIAVSAAEVGYRANHKRAIAAVMEALDGEARPVALKVKTLRPAVTEKDYSQVLLLDQSEHRLTLFIDGEKTRQWIVATGTGDYPTPLGRYHIELKRYMPTWVNPAPDGWGKDMPESIPPGPKNPLGVRALNWSAPAIRFHGTQAVDSLGTDASHGCVRMHNDDVSELYDLVDVGAVILSQP